MSGASSSPRRRHRVIWAKAAVLQLDTSDIKSFDAFFEQVAELLQSKWEREKFDFLVNNAGIEASSLIGETTEEAFDILFNVHSKGVYFLTQKALPLIAGQGRIIAH
jgi:NAD(P)-dependent dehydrogenase (short-subunit alcohol dehydrogenase family)